MKSIYLHEVSSAFTGFSAYVFGAFLLLFGGIYTLAYNLDLHVAEFQYVLQNMSFLFIFIIPVVTMRVWAEERRQKTEQLLYALPLTMTQVVMGKYLALLTQLAVPVGLLGLYPLALSAYGNVPLGAAYSALCGFFFLGAALLAIGLLAGLVLCMKQAKRYGLTEDNVLDMVLWAVPSCIIGARLYYVIFYLDLYRNADGSLNWGEMVAVWDGGLAIYGAVIAGAIVAFFYTRHKKIKMGAMTDLAVMGLLLGQCIGRWANFINREAFGAETTLPWRMRLWTSATEYIEVHPTFFYESLWNLIGLLLILLVVSKARRFDGENTWFYFLWYGLGRFWIEGLRTDSLYLFNWTFLGQPIRVSQALSLLLAVTAAVMLFYNIKIKKHSRDELLVNQVAAEAAEGTAEADISTAEAGESVPAGQEEPELPQPPETQNGEGGETDGNTH